MHLVFLIFLTCICFTLIGRPLLREACSLVLLVGDADSRVCQPSDITCLRDAADNRVESTVGVDSDVPCVVVDSVAQYASQLLLGVLGVCVSLDVFEDLHRFPFRFVRLVQCQSLAQ